MVASLTQNLQTGTVEPREGKPSRPVGRSIRFASTRERSIWILAIALVPAVAWAVAQQLSSPVWVRALLAAVAAIAIVAAPEIRQRRARTDSIARNLRKFESATAEGRIQLVRDATLDQFRVHDASISVPYVARDVQDELDDAIRARRPVLIVGHSMSGKSRLAAERIKELHPDAPLLVPPSTAALRGIVDDRAELQGFVIWLDDLERYLKGDNPLDAPLLNQFVSANAIIVATIRRSALNEFRPTNEVQPPQWTTVQRFARVPLARRLTETEQHLARGRISDQATLDAIERYGLAEYLGGGPASVDRFDDGEVSNPVGYALVRAAIDWRRAGLVRRISAENLRTGMRFYLEDRPEVSTDDEAIQAGFDWATARINETVGLLGIHEERTEIGPANPLLSYEAFDYLVDVLIGRNSESGNDRFPIPVGMWTMVEATATASEQSDVEMASSRYFIGQPRVMEAVAHWVADSGDASRGLLITGSPGSGKSALMIQLRKELPDMLSGGGAKRDSIPLEPSSTRGISSRSVIPLFGRGIEDFKNALAMELELPLPPAESPNDMTLSNRRFVDFLRAQMDDRRGQTVMLIDGLDEAREPRAIADLLLLLVSPSSHLPLRVILSSRHTDLNNPFGHLGWTVLDLDSHPLSHAELKSWIIEQLSKASSPYAREPILADRAAEQILRITGDSFLHASLLVTEAMSFGETAPPDDVIPGGIPSNLVEVIEGRLWRLGADRDDAVAFLRIMAESGNSLTAQELLAEAARRGMKDCGPARFKGIMSQLSSLLDVSGGLKPQEETYSFAHLAIRDAFLLEIS